MRFKRNQSTYYPSKHGSFRFSLYTVMIRNWAIIRINLELLPVSWGFNLLEAGNTRILSRMYKKMVLVVQSVLKFGITLHWLKLLGLWSHQIKSDDTFLGGARLSRKSLFSAQVVGGRKKGGWKGIPDLWSVYQQREIFVPKLCRAIPTLLGYAPLVLHSIDITTKAKIHLVLLK